MADIRVLTTELFRVSPRNESNHGRVFPGRLREFDCRFPLERLASTSPSSLTREEQHARAQPAVVVWRATIFRDWRFSSVLFCRLEPDPAAGYRARAAEHAAGGGRVRVSCGLNQTFCVLPAALACRSHCPHDAGVPRRVRRVLPAARLLRALRAGLHGGRGLPRVAARGQPGPRFQAGTVGACAQRACFPACSPHCRPATV